MKNLLPIITIGFLILSGIGATAQTSEQNQINEFSIPEENQQSFDFTHTIIGEYGTATWCGYCKYAHGALKNIYGDGQYPFYYVSLVTDKNSEAMQRASQLGISGIPAVHFDGSYRVNVGAGSVPSAQTTYENSINACGARTVDDIDINVAVNWLGGTEMQITVTITNNEGSTYNGHLRTYITEKISSMGWTDTGGNLYTFPLLHFAFNEGISISSDGTWEETITWDGTSMGYNSITEDNILVIASVYSG